MSRESLKASVRIARSESVEFADLGDEVVMLDLDSGKYLELDDIGGRIWMLLESRPTMTALRDALAAEFDVDDETCLNDLAEFIEELAGRGLVVVEADQALNARS